MNIILGSLIRHLLTLLGGGLIAIGVNESDASSFVAAAEPVVGGLALATVAQGWSLVEKRNRKVR